MGKASVSWPGQPAIRATPSRKRYGASHGDIRRETISRFPFWTNTCRSSPDGLPLTGTAPRSTVSFVPTEDCAPYLETHAAGSDRHSHNHNPNPNSNPNDWSYNPRLPKLEILELISSKFVQNAADALLIGHPRNRQKPYRQGGCLWCDPGRLPGGLTGSDD